MGKFLWYSGATDVTGKAIADALGITSTKVKPKTVAGDLVIGWGVKTDEDTNLAAGTIWNHPNAIRDNRDKLGALKKMAANANLASAIAKFSSAANVMLDLDHNRVALPLIGRTKSHQGGKGFWMCPTKHMVKLAINAGADYFQSFIDIKDEYRLHVAFGEVILAVKKEENGDEGSWTAPRKEKVTEYAAKNNIQIDNGTLNAVLKVMFKEAVVPDYIIRSNKRGWKFVSVNLPNVPAALRNAAIKAVEIMGLQFGAVDCAISIDNNPYIIEINSGPGLQGNALQKYTDMFKVKIAALAAPVPKKVVLKKVAMGVGAQEAAPAAVVGKKVDKAKFKMMMAAVNSVEEARVLLDLISEEDGE
jgi:glutathione synthase/RimK-type ligase-like ATP-grasp enzyme